MLVSWRGGAAWLALMAMTACVRLGYDPAPVTSDAGDGNARDGNASDAGDGDTTPDRGSDGSCGAGLAIVSPEEGASITGFEHTFTGTCNDALPLTVTPGPSVTIIESSCLGCNLRIVVGFAHVGQAAEDRTITVQNGQTVVRTVRFRTACPPGYVGVAGEQAMGTGDFCIAIYEMKKEEGGMIDADGSAPNDLCADGWSAAWVAVSTAEGLPWTCLTFANARGACASLDDGTFDFGLLTNAQWQTVAHNIESTAANWTAGGVLKQGSIGKPCAGGDPDACYALGGKTDRVADQNAIARHVLRNGEDVWDLCGNVWDMVDPDGAGGTVGYTGPANDAWYEYGSSEAQAAYASTADFSAQDFEPLGSYPAPVSEKGVGKIYLIKGTVSSRGIARGGHFNDAWGNGLFASFIGPEVTTVHPWIGFRCASSVVQR